MVMDFEDEFRELRDLMVYPTPRLLERDFKEIVRSLFDSLLDETDTDFQVADFSYSTSQRYFLHLGNNTDKMFALQQLLLRVGDRVKQRLTLLRAYVTGIFPYRCEDVIQGCDVVLVNSTMGNYYIEANQVPFLFKH